MEVLAMQQQYEQQIGTIGSNKVKDWTTVLTPPTNRSNGSIHSSNAPSDPAANTDHGVSHGAGNKPKSSIRELPTRGSVRDYTATAAAAVHTDLFHCDRRDEAGALSALSARLLNELRAAKLRHLACTEVSIPCDLTPRIAAEILRLSEREPCGIRGCTLYIEYIDDAEVVAAPATNTNTTTARRIGLLKYDDDTISTFELYLTLRQDQRGWIALLPQFMKSLTRNTITISPDFAISKRKLYSAAC